MRAAFRRHLPSRAATRAAGLIEIATLARLNAVRWVLNGDATVDSSAYRAVFTRFAGRLAHLDLGRLSIRAPALI